MTYQQLTQPAEAFLREVAERVRVALRSHTPVEVHKEIMYATQEMGHLLRPFLVYATAVHLDAYNEQTREKLIWAGVAAELLHTASLLHDDVLDREQTRRGRPSMNMAFGEKQAILSGNVHYIEAFSVALHHLGPEAAEAILRTASAMCTGEILQAGTEGTSMPFELYEQIICLKTGVLTAFACQEAARALGAEAAVERMRVCGECLGVLYQLQDDAQDHDADTDTPGRIPELIRQRLADFYENAGDVHASPLDGLASLMVRKMSNYDG